MPTVTIPHKFSPRDYQAPLFEALDNGYKRVLTVWHRRAGKDKSLWNLIIKKAFERKGVYFYFFPTYGQGRKVIWNGMDRSGFRFVDHIPPEVRVKFRADDMLVELINGSIIQVIGTDNYDSIMGSNPIGCVFSEYSLQNPAAWEFIRPILRENGGWAAFNYTPRGKNHGYKLYAMARKNDKWFTQILTVDDTDVLTEADIQEERDAGMSEDMIRQEFYCSFDAAIQGAYYGDQIQLARQEGRITSVPWESNIPVLTYWDLGKADATAVWFIQLVGKEIHVIDYEEHNGEDVAFYAKLMREKPYVYHEYDGFNGPHDIAHDRLGMDKTVKAQFADLGLHFNVIANIPITDGIQAVRSLFNRCWFDENKCELGINALSSYRKRYDEKNAVYKVAPVHDWASHGADAFRYFAVGLDEHQSDIAPQIESSIPFEI